jgi:hypothetical protein
MRAGSSHSRIAYAENNRVADAGDALHRVANIDVEIVAEKEGIVLPVLRVNAAAEDEAADLFGDDDAGIFHRVR